MTDDKTHFECADPILYVEDMAAAVRYYEDALGFQKASWGSEWFTSVNRDKAGIYLAQRAQGHKGTWVWVGVGDVQKLYAELKSKGAIIRHEPRNYPWALEMHVEDVDGNILRMGSDAIEGRPFDDFVE